MTEEKSSTNSGGESRDEIRKKGRILFYFIFLRPFNLDGEGERQTDERIDGQRYGQNISTTVDR